MAWDFSTEPEFQEKLDWAARFCREEVEPLELVFPGAAYSRDPKALLGPEDGARVLAQRRLGGGRIHHAMRTVAQVRLAFDIMCERALSRRSHGKVIAEHQMVQEAIADSYADLNMLRLLVLWTAAGPAAES